MNLAIQPATTTTTVGANFMVTIQVQAGAQQVDGASAHIDFDPAFLRVVSLPSGGSALNVPIQNAYNNTLGTLDYSAGAFSGFPSGTFTLATVTFTSIAGSTGTGTQLLFHTAVPRQSDVTFGGSSVLGGTLPGTVVVALPAPIPTMPPLGSVALAMALLASAVVAAGQRSSSPGKIALGATLVILVVSFAADPARAEDADFGRSGPYVGVGASRSVDLVEPFLDGTPILENITISDSWGANARLGYRLTSWFSVEAEYEWLQPFNVGLDGVHLGTLGAQSATANLRFILPLSRFQPYLLLGAGAMFLKVDDPLNVLTVDRSPFAGRVGLGLDVYLTQSLLLNVGAEGVLTPAGLQLNTGSGTISENGLGTLTFQFGLGYRF